MSYDIEFDAWCKHLETLQYEYSMKQYIKQRKRRLKLILLFIMLIASLSLVSQTKYKVQGYSYSTRKEDAAYLELVDKYNHSRFFTMNGPYLGTSFTAKEIIVYQESKSKWYFYYNNNKYTLLKWWFTNSEGKLSDTLIAY